MEKELITQLETNVDHLTGEELGMALTALNDMPFILDALYIPAIGKKNRPCGILLALCHPADENQAVEAIFRHTHTLGVRRALIERYTLPRRAGNIQAAGGEIPAKIYELENEEYIRPEAGAIQRAAARLNVGAPALRLAAREKS